MTKEDVMGNQSQLHPQTRENLLRAMRREAFAFARYLLYATQAREHGRQEVAELFEKVAEEEYFGHFTEQALELGLIGMEAENLHLAIEEEAFEADVMYRDSRPRPTRWATTPPPSGSGACARTNDATATSSWPSWGPWIRPSRTRPGAGRATASTVDHLSGGRMVCSAWARRPADADDAAFGEPDDARVLAERLDEGSRWSRVCGRGAVQPSRAPLPHRPR